MVVVSLVKQSFCIILFKMEFVVSSLVQEHLSKMVFLKGNIDILLNWDCLWCIKLLYLFGTGWRHLRTTANFLINRLPSTVLQIKSPHVVLFKKDHSYLMLRVFGSCCYPYIRHYTNNKFEQLSLPCVFLGYSDKHKGYRCLHRSAGRVYISRHVIFDEHKFPFALSIYSFSG